MKLSSYQEAILKFAIEGCGNAIVQAVAGSGKTFTLMQILGSVTGNVIFMAFNKSIQTALLKKIQAAGIGAECKTIHSFGYGVLSSMLRKRPELMKPQKTMQIMDNYQPLQIYDGMTPAELETVQEDREVVSSMVALVKNSLVDFNNFDELQAIAEHHGVEDFEDKHVPYIQYVMQKSIQMANAGMIDYDDMVYMPVISKAINRVCNYDFILVDESQDLNRAQIEFLLQMMGKSTRVICVGDRAQSIYGFRGADVNAMNRLQEALNAVELPLSICYRCPSSHVNFAKSIVPQIEAREDAPIGEMHDIAEKDFVTTLTSYQPSEVLTISRTNASLVKYALMMLAKGKKAMIQGRDLLANLRAIVNRIAGKKYISINQFATKLDKWYDREVERAKAKKASQSVIDRITDKYDSIKAIIQGCDSVKCVLDKINNIFGDATDDSEYEQKKFVNAYLFSTVHRAKGLEAQNVFILNPEKLPLKWKGQMDWELAQEMNIKYVAYTRSQDKIYKVIATKD